MCVCVYTENLNSIVPLTTFFQGCQLVIISDYTSIILKSTRYVEFFKLQTSLTWKEHGLDEQSREPAVFAGTGTKILFSQNLCKCVGT